MGVSTLGFRRFSFCSPVGGPSLVPFDTVRYRAITAGPHASINGLGPATSAVVRAFSGRRSISSQGGGFIRRGHPLGKVVGPSRLWGDGFRTRARPTYGASAGPTLPFITAICRCVGLRRVGPS